MLHGTLGAVAAAPVALELGVVTIALIAIALLLGIELIVAFVSWLTSPVADVPVLGLLNNAANWARNAVGNARNWLWQNANPVHIVAQTWGWLVSSVFTPLTHLGESTYNAIAKVLTQDIPGAVQAAVGIAHTYVLIVDSYIAALTNVVSALAASTARAIAAAEAAVIHYTQLVVGEAETAAKAMASALWAGIEAAKAAVLLAVRVELAVTVLRFEAELQLLDNALRAFVGAVIADTLGLVRTMITTAVLPLERGLADVVGRVGTMAATLAWAIPLVRTLEREWTNYRDNCGIKLCNNLGPLADMFQQLEQDVEIAALLALAVELIEHPDAVEGVIRDVVAPPITEVVDMVSKAA